MSSTNPMADTLPPSEIAREVLLRLAKRRLPPTPTNYLAIYQEISGIKADEAFDERAFKAILGTLPRTSPEQLRLARQLDEAVAAKSWSAISNTINDLVAKAGGAPLHWSGLIRNLLAQLDSRASGLTTAKKREALDHVLNSSSNPELLFQRLQSLTRNWARTPTGSDVVMVDGDIPDALADLATPALVASAAATQSPKADGDFRELSALLLQNTIVSLLIDAPQLADEARKLATDIRTASGSDQLPQLATKTKNYSYRVSFVAEDQSEVRNALLKLLRLMIDNIGDLVVDDKWLHGQIAIVSSLISQQPLSLRQLDAIESRLRDLIVKQSALKQNLTEAQDRLKSMLATFVDRLADFSESTSDYHGVIEKCAERITQADNISELSDVLDDVMRETRGIQINALRSHNELSAMRQRVDESEREISRLQIELAQASEMVRHDALTGVLNRKGMDEALEREVARAKRHGGPLSVALLDIDNFKNLNDTLGHDVGDAALIHLASIVRDTIRPQDTLARYGGEEFVILLPNTNLEDATNAMVRVQRELTKKFFLHDQEKILITFSCGVAELTDTEAPEEAVKRADGAMYLAKRMGKNRVITA